ncbi:zinc metalloprotease HtpX [Candidatus Dependentiae bacterium]
MFLNRVKTFLLLVGLSILLLVLGNIFGGYRGLQIALIFSLAINAIAYFWSDKIVLGLYRAKKMDVAQYNWVHEIVQELTEKMNIPMPKLWIIESSMANAFATGRNPSHASVAVTSRIIDVLDKEELRGVLAHELAHVKNRDILVATIAATIATTISYMASMLRYSAFFGSIGNVGSNRRNGSPIAMILMSIVMPIAALIIQLAISRNREYLADETGAKYSQDPLALASALEKLHNSYQHTARQVKSAGKESTASLFIVNPFSGKSMIKLFSTHPPVNERIKRLKKIHEDMYHM